MSKNRVTLKRVALAWKPPKEFTPQSVREMALEAIIRASMCSGLSVGNVTEIFRRAGFTGLLPVVKCEEHLTHKQTCEIKSQLVISFMPLDVFTEEGISAERFAEASTRVLSAARIIHSKLDAILATPSSLQLDDLRMQLRNAFMARDSVLARQLNREAELGDKEGARYWKRGWHTDEVHAAMLAAIVEIRSEPAPAPSAPEPEAETPPEPPPPPPPVPRAELAALAGVLAKPMTEIATLIRFLAAKKAAEAIWAREEAAKQQKALAAQEAAARAQKALDVIARDLKKKTPRKPRAGDSKAAAATALRAAGVNKRCVDGEYAISTENAKLLQLIASELAIHQPPSVSRPELVRLRRAHLEAIAAQAGCSGHGDLGRAIKLSGLPDKQLRKAIDAGDSFNLPPFRAARIADVSSAVEIPAYVWCKPEYWPVWRHLCLAGGRSELVFTGSVRSVAGALLAEVYRSLGGEGELGRQNLAGLIGGHESAIGDVLHRGELLTQVDIVVDIDRALRERGVTDLPLTPLLVTEYWPETLLDYVTHHHTHTVHGIRAAMRQAT